MVSSKTCSALYWKTYRNFVLVLGSGLESGCWFGYSTILVYNAYSSRNSNVMVTAKPDLGSYIFGITEGLCLF
jgi:hypothetical protein